MAVQRQQIDIFVDGLQEDQLKLNFLRVNTQTLDAVITTATNDQNLCKRFSLLSFSLTRYQYVLMIKWRSIIIGQPDVVLSVIKEGILLKIAIQIPE